MGHAESDALLAGVARGEVARALQRLRAGLVGPGEPQIVGMAVRLDLDHLGAEIGENAGDEGTRADPAKVQHSQTRKPHRAQPGPAPAAVPLCTGCGASRNSSRLCSPSRGAAPRRRAGIRLMRYGGPGKTTVLPRSASNCGWK